MTIKQKMFYNYMMSKTPSENKTKLKALIQESFKKQEDGSFNMDYVDEVAPKYLALIKEKYVDEVKKTLEIFKKKIKK